MSPIRTKPPYVPQGNVIGFPYYDAIKRMEQRGFAIRFTLTLDDLQQEVEVTEILADSLIPESHVFTCVVCPTDTLDTGEGSRAIKVTRTNSGDTTYI